jgi:FRG domain
MSIKESHIETIEIRSAPELFKKIGVFEDANTWIFRGQGASCWPLQTSMDRMFKQYDDNIPKLQVEIALIKRFQREAHHYGITNTNYLNIPEWLSLMQHYGAPTRLLDWTHSPWVALFFAIIELKENSNAALWIIDWNQIDLNTNKNILKLYERDYNIISIDDFIKTVNSGNGIIKLNSFKQNQRQIIQQGTFLFPTNIEKPFEDNMNKYLRKNKIKKIELPYSIKSEVIKKLYRMNISYATLYPGIEGFSRSLNHLHHIKGILKLEDNIKNYSGYKKKFLVATGPIK